MRVVIDYRPALRDRSGVGETTHQIAKALVTAYPRSAATRPLSLTLFSSSWKDRLHVPSDLTGVDAIDRRVPVSVLNFAWHRLGWPAVEQLTGRAFDVAHSAHPLLMPARAAAQVVTIHDLDFLSHPERTRAEVRRDYPALVGAHAHRADAIVVPSAFTAAAVERQLAVPRAKIFVCPHGAPPWAPRQTSPSDGYVLFLGTIEPRKNVAGLLDAYEQLVARLGSRTPELVLAGKITDQCRSTLDRIARAPLAGHVRHIGYVQPDHRDDLYRGARLLVQPSFDEGFGMPVLEAMTIGVPVVASNRGALPELLGDAGRLVEPDDPTAMADAISELMLDAVAASAAIDRGRARSRQFSWERTAQLLYGAYERAIQSRRSHGATG